MDFDRYTVTLLLKREDAPQLDETAEAELQDAHMAHLAGLAEKGRLLAAGPLFDEQYRGLSILNVPPEEARALKDADPAVQAGVYSVVAMAWMLPAGAMSFSRTRFPRSVAEANNGS
jgi:uncharacterized protein YciI